MNRRTLLGLTAGSGLIASAGCLNRVRGSSTDTEFYLVESEVSADAPPEVTVEDGIVTVTGTVTYGSSSCGTIDLAHDEYEASQHRLDLLVVAAAKPTSVSGCTDDLRTEGYRVERPVGDDLRRIAATEHHVFGETYSTTVDLTDY